MKVSNRVLIVTSVFKRALVAIPLVMAISLGATPAPALAITRPAVIKRANTWIKKRVKYSQSGYYGGYRRDCSGFVSMAWKLRKSYTSSTIRSRAKKIAWRHLLPGDAVRRTGHVEIFAGWKNKRARLYWALEESTYGKPALRRAKTFKSGYSALRFKGISSPVVRPVVPVKPKPPVVPIVPKPPVVIPVTPLPSTDATPSLGSSPTVLPTILL